MQILKIIILCLVMFMTALVDLHAKNIYLASTGSDNNTGTDVLPYASLGKALTMANSGDMIYVKDMIEIKKEQIGTEVGQVETGGGGVKFPSGLSNVSIIGLSKTNSGFTGLDGNNCLRIFNMNGANGFTIKNLTITKGMFGTSTSAFNTGVINIVNSDVKFENCNFVLNGYSRSTYGGVVFQDNSSTVFKNCLFDNNYSSSNGGAIYIRSGSLVVDSCTFTKNRGINGGVISSLIDGANSIAQGKAVNIICRNSQFSTNTSGYGGAIYLSNNTTGKSVSLKVTSCSFIENNAIGGAVFLDNRQSSTANDYLIVNSTFYRNSSSGYGGAILLNGGKVGDTFDIINCTLTENISEGNTGNGAGLKINDTSTGTILNTAKDVKKRILNSIFENNYSTNHNTITYYSDISASYTPDTTDLVIKNSLIGADDNGTLGGTYMGMSYVNYYASANTFAEFSSPIANFIATQNSIPLQNTSIAAGYGNPKWLQDLNITTDQTGNNRLFANNKCTAGAIEVIPQTSPLLEPSEPVYKSYNGLVMAGYQGWFTASGDNSGSTPWIHCGRNGLFQPGSASIEFYPDMTEYTKKYTTGLKNPDGSVANFFSSADEETIDLHFKWMQQYGIDGIFLQRFLANFNATPRGRVLQYVVKAAKKYNRTFSIMYDLTTMSKASDVLAVLNDWNNLNTKYHFTDPSVCPTYLNHNGKPLVAIWGIGIYSSSQPITWYENIMDSIQDLKGQKGNISIMFGSSYYWLNGGNDAPTNTTELKRVLKKSAIISPWSVGRYNMNNYKYYENSCLIPDISWCNQNGVDYAPVVYPGFSWRNLKQLAVSSYDQIPRTKGDFLWLQIAEAKKSGAEMIYVAMFDELDEGTCIFKCVNSSKTPILATSSDPQGKFLGIDDEFPTDYYLFLTGQASKWFKGATGFGDKKPAYQTLGVERNLMEQSMKIYKQGSNLIISVLESGNSFIELINISGKIVFRAHSSASDLPLKSAFDISKLERGVYLVKVNLNGTLHTGKIII